MGLRHVFVAVLLVSLIGCTPKSVVILRNKVYVDCCNPSLGYNEKDMCKWAQENPGKMIVQDDKIYDMIWSDCKIGEEPWRRWE